MRTVSSLLSSALPLALLMAQPAAAEPLALSARALLEIAVNAPLGRRRRSG